MGRKRIPTEALIDLRRRLGAFPPRSQERREMMQATAELFGVSEATLYRALRLHSRPKALRRSDTGLPESITCRSDGVLLRTHCGNENPDIE